MPGIETAVLLLHIEYQVLVGCWLQELCCQVDFHEEQHGQGMGTRSLSLMPVPVPGLALPECSRKKKITPVKAACSKGVKARAIDFGKTNKQKNPKLSKRLILHNKRSWLRRDQLQQWHFLELITHEDSHNVCYDCLHWEILIFGDKK